MCSKVYLSTDATEGQFTVDVQLFLRIAVTTISLIKQIKCQQMHLAVQLATTFIRNKKLDDINEEVLLNSLMPQMPQFTVAIM